MVPSDSAKSVLLALPVPPRPKQRVLAPLQDAEGAARCRRPRPEAPFAQVVHRSGLRERVEVGRPARTCNTVGAVNDCSRGRPGHALPTDNLAPRRGELAQLAHLQGSWRTVLQVSAWLSITTQS